MTNSETLIVKLEADNVYHLAGNVLLYGGIIVYPTDTLYGFGVDARNETSINKLYKLKGSSTPFSVIAPDLNTVLSWTNLERSDWLLVKQYLRGYTTIVLPIKEGVVHPKIMGPDGTLGIRIPAHTFGPKLTHKLGFPITTTSVNRSGKRTLNNPEKIMSEFGGEIDLLVDGGNLPESSGSTVYKLEKSKLIIIRP